MYQKYKLQKNIPWHGTQPEMFLLYETFKPISTTLVIINTFDFIRKSVPMTTYATVNSIFGASYFGVGRGLGGLAGGYAISDLGFRLSFRYYNSGGRGSPCLFTDFLAILPP